MRLPHTEHLDESGRLAVILAGEAARELARDTISGDELLLGALAAIDEPGGVPTDTADLAASSRDLLDATGRPSPIAAKHSFEIAPDVPDALETAWTASTSRSSPGSIRAQDLAAVLLTDQGRAQRLREVVAAELQGREPRILEDDDHTRPPTS